MEEEGTPHSSNYRLVFAINKPPEDRIWQWSSQKHKIFFHNLFVVEALHVTQDHASKRHPTQTYVAGRSLSSNETTKQSYMLSKAS